jgi:gliding motility-associated-like protein
MGCDSIVTLHLTVNHATYGDTTVIACNSFSWHGITYTETPETNPTYTMDNGNHAGCDSIVTLHLTINHSSSSEFEIEACDRYVWNDTTYIGSGNYTRTFTNAAGCDSTVTLHLTINHPHHLSITQNACLSFEWNGTTYTTSGDYYYEHPDENGCTQVDTLHLTISEPSYTSTSEYVCEPYTWNGVTYTSTGTYVYRDVESDCEQVDTLHLFFVDTTTTIISHTYNFCKEEQAILEVSSTLPHIEWSTGDTLPIITVFEPGTYTVTASQGQCSISRQYTIQPCEHKILLPNAFTPNGDGLNDVFCIPEGYLDQLDDYGFEVFIYDRWGELVFMSNNKEFHWDGTVKGRLLHNNTYIYLIKYVNKSGAEGLIKGSVIVL